MRRGHTLLELALVVLLVGTAASSLAGAARLQADRMAVAGAREALVGLFARARAEARLHGGARLVLAPGDGVARVEAGSRSDTLALARDFGVALAIPGDPAEAVLLFDALGVGRRASRTLVLSRGDAVTRLAVAAYGRVERR